MFSTTSIIIYKNAKNSQIVICIPDQWSRGVFKNVIKASKTKVKKKMGQGYTYLFLTPNYGHQSKAQLLKAVKFDTVLEYVQLVNFQIQINSN